MGDTLKHSWSGDCGPKLEIIDDIWSNSYHTQPHLSVDDYNNMYNNGYHYVDL